MSDRSPPRPATAPDGDGPDADAVVVGAGPAGLMAAEVMAGQGLSVLVLEAKPSAGRKVLMAGKSGLNLTHAGGPDMFRDAYAEAADRLAPMLDAFGADAVQDWARGLGQPVFTGTSGRVFPEAMKASPLLRAWLHRLDASGVRLRTRWRWTGFATVPPGPVLAFDTPAGPRCLTARVAVLAAGGASWARLGSDGAWAGALGRAGVALAPFAPANVGLALAWSDRMAPHFGAPVKSVALHAGGTASRGEFVLTPRGIEGGGVYSVSRAVREGAPLRIDLFPDLPAAAVADRLRRQAGRRDSLGNRLRKALGLAGARMALVQEWARPFPASNEAAAALLKALPVPVNGTLAMDEAISTAGGVRFEALDSGLQLRAVPGVFCAGEMLDWEAPTGGFLLTACLSTGHWAGLAAARFLGRCG